MTVRDLVLGADDDLEGIEVVVREGGKGKWIYGFRISKKARLHPIDSTIEHRELYPWIKTNKTNHDVNCEVPEGEVVTVRQSHLDYPIKVMCIDPKKAPKDVLDLEVCKYLPRNIPVLHGDKLFNNSFNLEIWAYMPEQTEKLAVFKEIDENKIDDDQLAGQMSIEDFLGGD
jgi:hypothetical protein